MLETEQLSPDTGRTTSSPSPENAALPLAKETNAALPLAKESPPFWLKFSRLNSHKTAVATLPLQIKKLAGKKVFRLPQNINDE